MQSYKLSISDTAYEQVHRKLAGFDSTLHGDYLHTLNGIVKVRQLISPDKYDTIVIHIRDVYNCTALWILDQDNYTAWILPKRLLQDAWLDGDYYHVPKDMFNKEII